MSFGAFARTRLLKAPKKDVDIAFSKWWAKYKPAEGEITQHLAANEQSVVLPWLKTWPHKMQARVPIYLWPFGLFAGTFATMEFTDWCDRQEDLNHRF